MQRKSLIAYAIGASVSSATVGAPLDAAPFIEYGYTSFGPAIYAEKVDSVASEAVDRLCQYRSEECVIYNIGDGGKDGISWHANYYVTLSNGNTSYRTLGGGNLMGCTLPTKLYIVYAAQTVGPVANRSRLNSPQGVCRYEGMQPTPAPPLALDHSDLGPGNCLTHPTIGNPISPGVRNKFEHAVDIHPTAASSLSWSRYYNSGIVPNRAARPTILPEIAQLGSGWRGTYNRSLSFVEVDLNGVVYRAARLNRHTGEQVDFIEEGERFRSTVDARGLIARTGKTWTYRTPEGETEGYDEFGRLASLESAGRPRILFKYEANAGASARLVEAVDAQGRKLAFVYDATGRLITVTDSAGAAIRYSYAEADSASLSAELSRVTYPDDTFIRYLYDEAGLVGEGSRRHALTGIVDESGVRIASFHYDEVGHATKTEHANGTSAFSLVASGDGDITVTTPTSATYTYRYADLAVGKRLKAIDQPGGSGCAASYRSIQYDDNGNVSKLVDFDDRVTTFTYDVYGDEIRRTEADGTPLARSTETEWNSTLGLPTKVASQGREEQFTYNARGNITRYEVRGAIDPNDRTSNPTLNRAWNFMYDADERLKQIHGPRSDTDSISLVNRYTHFAGSQTDCSPTRPCDYRKGDLAEVFDATGKVDEVLRYDMAGRITARRDARGLVTEYLYDPRGRVTEIREKAASGNPALSRFSYTVRGDVSSATDPDGVTLGFEYDDARRLVAIHNASGHRLSFAYDNANRVTRRESHDADGKILTQLTRTYDVLGRVAVARDGEGHESAFTYDPVGRPTSHKDPESHLTTASYDGLGRLRHHLADVEGVAASIDVAHDPLDQLTSVTDPKGLVTSYLVTGLGDIAAVNSPDAGQSFDEHDAAGNLSRHEGPNGSGSYTVTRDALSRPLKIHFDDAGMEVSYTYDKAVNTCPTSERTSSGRLTQAVTTHGTTFYCHDAWGRVARKIQRWDGAESTVTYRYTPAGRLAQEAVVGTATVDYRYDSDGNVAAVDVTRAGAPTTPLVARASYLPFDAVSSWTYGNGRQMRVTRDRNGRPTEWGDFAQRGFHYALTYSPSGDIATQVGPGFDFRLSYDGLGRVTGTTDLRTYEVLRKFTYDATGNRLTASAGTTTDPYVYAGDSHHLLSADGRLRRYDDAGNTVSIGTATLAYDAAGRLVSASEGGRELVTYGYDGEGQRVFRKTPSGSETTLYLLDPGGRWLADLDTSGRVVRQGVWMDDQLVGLVEGQKTYYVESDHVGTPRVVVDPERNVDIWHWLPDADPFGSHAPDEDPDGDGKPFVLDLRFPGQRYDALTGLYANGARDYDAVTGRYIQSDPIGLLGGISTYLYGNGSPLLYTDPLGLAGRAPQDAGWRVAFKAMMVGKAAHLGIQADVEKDPEIRYVKSEVRTFNIRSKNFGVVDLMLRNSIDDPWSVFEIKPGSQFSCPGRGDIQQLRDYVTSLNQDGVRAVVGKWSDFFPGQKNRAINIPTGVVMGGIRVDGSYFYGSPEDNGMIYYEAGDATYPKRK